MFIRYKNINFLNYLFKKYILFWDVKSNIVVVIKKKLRNYLNKRSKK